VIGPDAEIQRLGGATGHTFFDYRRFMVHKNTVNSNIMNERLREVPRRVNRAGKAPPDPNHLSACVPPPKGVWLPGLPRESQQVQ
jgi:hypothetical protein